MRKTLLVCLTPLILLATVLISRALFFDAQPLSEVAEAHKLDLNIEAIVDHTATALSFKTVSHQDKAIDEGEFSGFADFLERSYPAIHSGLSKQVFAGHSLLYHWPGSNPQLEPILLLAHYDVVPAGNTKISPWRYPPFSGTRADGYLWGRGTLDDKGSLIAIMEAVEALLRQGHQPERSVYLAFGHDEEIGGEGARAIAAHFAKKNQRFEFVLDEGSFITEGLLPFVDAPVALIGPAEKGYLTLQLSTQAQSGHASMPPRNTAVGIISQAISRIENYPMAVSFDFSDQLLERVRPHMSFLARILFLNDWLFLPLIAHSMEMDPLSNAAIRTTAAATMFHSGEKENVLPSSAEATVNFRILPGDSIDSVISHVERVIDDERVTISQLGTASEASPVSSIHGPAYRLLEQTLRQSSRHSELVVAPRLVVAATDARHFSYLSDQVFRFACFTIDRDTLKGIHGQDERVLIEDLEYAVRFYYSLLKNSEQL